MGKTGAYVIAGLPKGEFSFRPGAGESGDIAFAVQALLMEALRRRDEAAGKG